MVTYHVRLFSLQLSEVVSQPILNLHSSTVDMWYDSMIVDSMVLVW